MSAYAADMKKTEEYGLKVIGFGTAVLFSTMFLIGIPVAITTEAHAMASVTSTILAVVTVAISVFLFKELTEKK